MENSSLRSSRIMRRRVRLLIVMIPGQRRSRFHSRMKIYLLRRAIKMERRRYVITLEREIGDRLTLFNLDLDNGSRPYHGSRQAHWRGMRCS